MYAQGQAWAGSGLVTPTGDTKLDAMGCASSTRATGSPWRVRVGWPWWLRKILGASGTGASCPVHLELPWPLPCKLPALRSAVGWQCHTLSWGPQGWHLGKWLLASGSVGVIRHAPGVCSGGDRAIPGLHVSQCGAWRQE